MARTTNKTLSTIVLTEARKIDGFKKAEKWASEQVAFNGEGVKAESASESAMYRYDLVNGLDTALATHAEAIKAEGHKVADFAEAVCAKVGISYKTIKNFRPVAKLSREQAEKSLNVLGLQGTVSTAKKFGFLDAEAVNGIAVQVAEKLGDKAPEGSARHFLKLATELGAKSPDQSAQAVLVSAYTACVNDAEAVVEAFKSPEKKSAEQVEIEELKKEVARLKADLKAVRAENQSLKLSIAETAEPVKAVA